jgi:hypothetical protein
MAAIHQYAHFRDTPEVDGLCPHCFNPALKRYVLQRIDLDGITNVGERIACTDCKVWTTKLKEYNK